MSGEIWSWISGHLPVLGLTIAIAVLVGCVVWIAAKFYFQRFKAVESKVDGLQCGACMEEINILRQSTGKLDSLCEQVNEISKWIMKLDYGEQ